MPLTGSLAAGLASTRIRHSLRPLGIQLVEEYATILGMGTPEPWSDTHRQMFDAAVKYLHMNLLQDLDPPWMTHPFLQALPGKGLLCCYTKATFLYGDFAQARSLFGDAIMDRWQSWVSRWLACWRGRGTSARGHGPMGPRAWRWQPCRGCWSTGRRTSTSHVPAAAFSVSQSLSARLAAFCSSVSSCGHSGSVLRPCARPRSTSL